MHIRHIMLPARLYHMLPHYLVKGTIFEKKKIVTEHNVCATNLSENFLILRRTERDMIKNVYTSSRKMSVIRVRF
jgi:hypothetical protein